LYSVWRQPTIMYITIDETDRRPIYRQVADEIKGLIARGSLSEGMALPPVRQVADDLGVNLNTIAAAYRELQREGLLKVRHGSGAVVSSRRLAQQSDSDLRKTLRASLTHLALAGIPRTEIVEIVNEEIRDLFRRER
jgi:GntR family transcriptional regulator